MIDLFVFDLGNVILPFDNRPIAVKLYERSRKDGTFSAQDIFDYLFDMERGSVIPYEEGLVSSVEFFLDVKRRYGLHIDFEEFKDVWNNIFCENQEVNDVIAYLKAKEYPVFLLSNTNELHFSHIIDRYPIVHVMDEWILSFEVGAQKPKKRIYETVFQRVEMERGRILYIDDIARYVDVARDLGMQGLVFKEAGDLWNLIKSNGL